jgi:hypothetical protein
VAVAVGEHGVLPMGDGVPSGYYSLANHLSTGGGAPNWGSVVYYCRWSQSMARQWRTEDSSTCRAGFRRTQWSLILQL